ncbi:MAG: hypothetical protein AVDCRST_MAG07-761, partial [uncultured Frankineae bacterium]
ERARPQPRRPAARAPPGAGPADGAAARCPAPGRAGVRRVAGPGRASAARRRCRPRL